MLTYPAQEDFAAGMFQGTARHLIPENGVYDLDNFLLDDDGSVYKRGGTEYQSNATFGTTLNWIWDGYLAGGQRTVFASPTAFGTLAADDVTPVNLGGTGLTSPVRAVELAGMLFIEGGHVYGGSRKTANYSTGTVSVTNGSATVNGSGTEWAANVDPGMLLRLGTDRFYAVSVVGGDTTLTLTEPYGGTTAAGQTYTLSRVGTIGSPYRSASVYATAGTRLVACEDNRVYLSAGTSATGLFQPHSFDATDYHELPGGARVLGAATIRDTLIVFTTAGVWSIANLALDLTDDFGNFQHQVQQINADLILWGKAGIASWRNALIVPTTSGVYLMDGISGPQSLSDPIRGLIADYVRAGYKPGGAAVYNGCYFLPILDAVSVPVDMLVCRLDRQVSTRLGATWPWSRFSGHAMDAPALAARRSLTGAPALLAACGDAKVGKFTGLFDPSAARTTDADGTAFRFRVETRDHATGPGTRNLVRRLKARYELIGSATLSAYYSVGEEVSDQSLWGSFNWDSGDWASASDAEFVQISGQAPADVGRSPYTWLDWSGVRTRHIRFRLESDAAAERFALRSMQWAIRPSGREE